MDEFEFFEMRFDLGTLDSGERSLPFGLLVLLSGTSVVHEGALYLISIFQSCATLEQALYHARVSTRVNIESLESRLSGVSLKL